MPIQLPTPKPRVGFRGRNGPNGPTVAAVTVLLAGACAAPALIVTLPSPLVLPMLGVLATLAAGAVALVAWLTAQRITAALTYWDVAGALTLVGIIATLLSEPELALPLFENQRTSN